MDKLYDDAIAEIYSWLELDQVTLSRVNRRFRAIYKKLDSDYKYNLKYIRNKISAINDKIAYVRSYGYFRAFWPSLSRFDHNSREIALHKLYDELHVWNLRYYRELH